MKTNKIKAIIFFTFLLNVKNISAQQEPQFTHFMDNMLYYNPGYAGSREMLSLSGVHRQQWVGVEGAPMTQTFSIHSPLRYKSAGLGLSVLNDKAGPINQSWINGSISYSLRFKKGDGRLSFGLNGGVNLLNGNLSTLFVNDENDQSLMIDHKNYALPILGGGVYYHSKHFFAGASCPKVFESFGTNMNSRYVDQRHYYAMVGGYLNLSRMLKLRPGILFKFTENAPFALDINLSLIVYDKLWIGANYRLQESFGGVFQFHFNSTIKGWVFRRF